MIQPPVKLTQTDVFAPRLGNSKVRPPLDVRDANVKDAAWMAHVSRVLKQGMLAEDMGLQLDASKRGFGEAPCRHRRLPTIPIQGRICIFNEARDGADDAGDRVRQPRPDQRSWCRSATVYSHQTYSMTIP